MVTAVMMMMMVVEVVRKSWLCIPVIPSRLDHFGRVQNLPSVEARKLMQGECMEQCLVQARV